MKSLLSLLAICAALFSGWNTHQESILKKAEWLLGTWENKTSGGIIYETWQRKDRLEFAGKSYVIQQNDTVVFETIRLVQENDDLIYIPTVNNQNDSQPVRFTLRTISTNQLIFENSEHDFPQVISYTYLKQDSLVAEISGIKNGQDRRQQFPMRKIR